MSDEYDLPPGSDEAIAEGCECPILDNRYGKGAYKAEGYIVSFDCPIHETEQEEKPCGNFHPLPCGLDKDCLVPVDFHDAEKTDEEIYNRWTGSYD